MARTNQRRIWSTILRTVLELGLMFLSAVFFVLIKEPTQRDILFFLGSLVIIVLLGKALGWWDRQREKQQELYHSIKDILNDLREEIRARFKLNLRVAYFIFDPKKDYLRIPRDCQYGLNERERHICLEEGEGVVGYTYLFHEEIKEGLLVDLKAFSSTKGYFPRLRQYNNEIVEPGLCWIYAQKVLVGERCCGIISVDSLEKEWTEIVGAEHDDADFMGIVIHKANRIANCYK